MVVRAVGATTNLPLTGNSGIRQLCKEGEGLTANTLKTADWSCGATNTMEDATDSPATCFDGGNLMRRMHPRNCKSRDGPVLTDLNDSSQAGKGICCLMAHGPVLLHSVYGILKQCCFGVVSAILDGRAAWYPQAMQPCHPHICSTSRL